MQTSLFTPPPRRAIFSPDRRYRYSLIVDLVADAPARGSFCADPLERRIAWLMLNPSIADETRDDPTVARCCKRSRLWGFTSLEVVNVYAIVGTVPEEALAGGDDDARGPENDDAIVRAVTAAEIVVCAWGKHATRSRIREIDMLLAVAGARGKARALKQNGDGSPAHPLYLPDALRPSAFDLSTAWGRR